MTVRTYTEKLERVIDMGVDLRHMMRVKSENKDAIIRQQAGKIKSLENELAQVKEEKKQKKASKNTPANFEVKLEKLQVRHDDQELYVQKLKNYIKERNGGVIPDELTIKGGKK